MFSSRNLIVLYLTSYKGNQSWIFIGGTDAEAEAPILWPPDVKNWLIRKGADAGKDWRQEEKGTTEDEMIGWHHWLNGHEFEEIPGVGDGQGGLACCGSWGGRESDTTERLNWTEVMIIQDDIWDSFLNWMEGVCLLNIHFYSIFLLLLLLLLLLLSQIMKTSGPWSFFLIFPCCSSQSVCLRMMFSQNISQRLVQVWGSIRSRVLPEGSFN